MKISHIIVAGIVASLMGCGGSGGGSNDLGKSSGSGMLEGVWELGCNVYEDNEAGKAKIQYTGNNVKANLNYYSDTSCSVSKATVVLEGTFSLGDEVILNSGESAYKITRNLTSAKVSYDADEYIAPLNTNKICGYANWKKGVLKDVSNCSTFKFVSEFEKDLVKVDGNNIFYGDTDYLGSDGYPTRLEGNFYSKE